MERTASVRRISITVDRFGNALSPTHQEAGDVLQKTDIVAIESLPVPTGQMLLSALEFIVVLSFVDGPKSASRFAGMGKDSTRNHTR